MVVEIGGGSEIIRFPPLICASSNGNINFYGIILPAAVIQAIGCGILVLLFWTVSQVNERSMYMLSCTVV
jgi:hypothetical protein